MEIMLYIIGVTTLAYLFVPFRSIAAITTNSARIPYYVVVDNVYFFCKHCFQVIVNTKHGFNMYVKSIDHLIDWQKVNSVKSNL